MSLIPSFLGGRGTNSFDLFALDVFDPFKDFPFPATFPRLYRNSAIVNSHVDWKKTPEAHEFRADLPGLKKEEVNVEVGDDGRVVQISGERYFEKEEKSYTWQSVERKVPEAVQAS